MDNNIEVTSNNPVFIPEEVTTLEPVKTNGVLRTVAPVAGGFAAGILAGYGIYKLVDKLIAKYKAKKAAAKIEVEAEPSKEE